MSYQFTVVPARNYVRAIGTGDNTAENLARFLLDAYRAAIARNCDSALLELNFSGESLSLGIIYAVIAERSSDGTQLRRIAFVDVNSGHVPEHSEFAEMAANKLGMNVRRFRNIADAESWLQE